MKEILKVRQAIYDHFHSSKLLNRPYAGFGSNDAYAAYYTSMYLIQDTAESLFTHRKNDFSTDPMRSYLEYWGLMQAVVIQQEAVLELYNAVCGSKSPISQQGGEWKRLRELRVITAGHPANADRRKTRSFLGRSFGTYDRITYEQHDISKAASTKEPFDSVSQQSFNLGEILDQYDHQAAAIIWAVLCELRKKWWPGPTN